MREFLNTVEPYFLLFIIYSMIGWAIEVLLQFIEKKRLINRGFLIGPYCPIYGFGAVVMTLILDKYQDNLIILFGMSMLICTVLEYLTSYIMEKLFKARWWDYSQKKFNLNGRVCLENSVLFGLGGVILLKFTNGFFLSLINDLSTGVRDFISLGVLIILLVDTIVSYITIYGFKKIAKGEEEKGDSTEEISNKVRETIELYKEKLADGFKEIASIISDKIASTRENKTAALKNKISEKSFLYRRLLKAFPKLEVRTLKDEKIKKKVLEDVKNKK